MSIFNVGPSSGRVTERRIEQIIARDKLLPKIPVEVLQRVFEIALLLVHEDRVMEVVDRSDEVPGSSVSKIFGSFITP